MLQFDRGIQFQGEEKLDIISITVKGNVVFPEIYPKGSMYKENRAGPKTDPVVIVTSRPLPLRAAGDIDHRVCFGIPEHVELKRLASSSMGNSAQGLAS